MVTPRADFWSGTTARARRFKSPLRAFVRTESGGAAVLLAATVTALVWVNVDSSSYEGLWETVLAIDLGRGAVELTLREWVNSGLMTFFFFVLGLEARREFDLGDLRERRRFVLPPLASVGGMGAADRCTSWSPARSGSSRSSRASSRWWWASRSGSWCGPRPPPAR